MEKRLKITGNLQTRAAFEASTFDEKRGTVEVTFTTGARGLRRSWEGPYYEELEVSEKAVDLARLNNGASVLNAHSAWDIRGVIGVVERAWIAGKRGRALVRFSDREDVKPIVQDVKSGVLRHVSVGYTVERMEQVEKIEDVPVYRATRWTPRELSLVPIGFDDGAVVRGRPEPEFYEVELSPPTSTRTKMENENLQDPTQARTETPEVLAERQRVTEIHAAVTRHDLGDKLASDLITRGVALERAREIILDRLAARSDGFEISPHLSSDDLLGRGRSPVVPGEDFADDFQRAAVDALLLRAGVPVKKPHAAAGDVSASVYDLARTCLSRAGKSATRFFGGEARGPELLKRAAGTGDFPAILEGALHASVRAGYENEPASHRQWVRVAPFADFREAKRPILGSAPNLDKLGEHAEYKHGYFIDDGTGYAIDKYGKIIALSWEALVNDNLGAFFRVQPALGQAARRLEANVVYALFALNAGAGPTMNDTKALFHVDHANLTGSAAFDAAQLGAGRALLRKQTAVGGGYLSLVPRFLIVPAERETAAEIILANASRRMTTEKTTAEWIASLELVVEPRLANTGVYLATDPNQVDTVELGLLEENMAGPFIETEQGFGTDESRWKIRHTAGAKALDWRGMVKMPIT